MEEDYAGFRRRIAQVEEDLTEARALIRDMEPHLQPPAHDCPGHLRARRAITELRKRVEAMGIYRPKKMGRVYEERATEAEKAAAR